jgi:hypothetical protein
MRYQVTKKQAEARIKGVCEGCGGKLEVLKTVNNSGEPTYWVSCSHCSCFRNGVDRVYWELARELIEKNEMIPYSHMSRHEYEDYPERLEYWFDSQCARLSIDIMYLHNLLKKKLDI